MTREEAWEKCVSGEITYEKFLEILKGLESKVAQTHSMVVDLKESLKPSMSALVASNQEAANTLKEMREDQKKQVDIIAGKNQVPALVFALVVGTVLLLLVIEKVDKSRTAVKITPNSIEARPHDIERDPKPAPSGAQ